MDGQFVDINAALKAQFAAADAGTLPPAPNPLREAVAEPNPAPVESQSAQGAPQLAPETPEAPRDERMAKVIAQATQARAEREAAKREREQHAAEMAELQQYRELRARAKDDPVAVAETFGFKPDEYAAVLIEKGAVTPEKRKLWEQQKEINDLKQWKQDFVQQQQQQTRQHSYNTIVNELKTFAEHSGETFDLVRRTGNYDLVMQKMQEHWETTEAMHGEGRGELLPYDQALEMAEKEIFDKVYAPVIESPKIKGAVQQVASLPRASQQAPAARPSGTITPKMRGISTPPAQLSEEQGLEAAGRLLFKQFLPGGR